MTVFAAAETVATAINWASVERFTIVGLLMTFLILMATGKVLTRKSADVEQQALKDGYKYIEEAHEETVRLLRERIATLEEQHQKKDKLMKERESQLTRVLDEIAPSLVAWAQATDSIVEESGGGSEDGRVGT